MDFVSATRAELDGIVRSLLQLAMKEIGAYITYKRNEMKRNEIVNFDSTLLSLNLYSDNDGALLKKCFPFYHVGQHSNDKQNCFERLRGEVNKGNSNLI